MPRFFSARWPLDADPLAGEPVLRRSWFVPALRGSLFALVSLLAILDGLRADAALWLLALGATAVAAQWRNRNDFVTRILILAEAAIATLGGLLTGGTDSPMFAYLPATTVAAGIAVGLDAAVITSGLIGVLLLVGRTRFAPGDASERYTAGALQIAFFSALAGALGGLLGSRLRDGAMASQERFAEAYRLLEQLRGVTRRLPGSLDPGSVATSLIAQCRGVAEFARAGVFLQSPGSVLVPVALDGMRRVPWRIDLDEPGPFADCWQSLAPVTQYRAPDTAGRRRGSHLLVLPIVVDDLPVGVVALESVGEQPLAHEVVALLRPIVATSGLPLETAVLFDELRSSAALEERERLAKDMHDGIAQDLAYVGFELDGLISELRKSGDTVSVQHAHELRARITGLISDLRLSMSDLLSSTGPTRGLGAALSEYARSVGTSSAITVHLSLAEGAIRLPSNLELELLRISHEAIAGARRRPGVRNLWVTLSVDPPLATIAVEDDGDEGLVRDRVAAIGVMRERADRIGAQVTASSRVPRGARVQIEVGGSVNVESASR